MYGRMYKYSITSSSRQQPSPGSHKRRRSTPCSCQHYQFEYAQPHQSYLKEVKKCHKTCIKSFKETSQVMQSTNLFSGRGYIPTRWFPEHHAESPCWEKWTVWGFYQCSRAHGVSQLNTGLGSTHLCIQVARSALRFHSICEILHSCCKSASTVVQTEFFNMDSWARSESMSRTGLCSLNKLPKKDKNIHLTDE